MFMFLDGTISYAEAERGWRYSLTPRFSEDQRSIPIARLDALQEEHRGSLEIYPDRDGSLAMRKTVVAHGAESAARQAESLRESLRRSLGLRMNIARVHRMSRA